MAKYKVDVNGEAHPADHAVDDHAAADGEIEVGQNVSDATAVVATVGVVVVGAALLEAALIPAILVGAAAALAPKYLPKLGERMQPLFNSTVRGAYKLGRKARSAVGEAKERMNDIAAEVDAEESAAAAAPAIAS